MAVGRAEDLLRLLQIRGLAIPREVRQRILDCTDLTLLDQWFEKAVTITDLKDLFDDEQA